MAKKKPVAKRAVKRAGSKRAGQVETAAAGAVFRTLRPDEMDALLRVLKTHQKALKAHKGVEKVDVGYRWKDGKMTGEVAIRVHVKAKKPINELEAGDVLPAEVAGFPIDVVESNVELHRMSRRNPVIGGVETRNVNIGGVGTLGAIVFDAANSNQRLALSNHHVYVDDRPNGAAGERVNQPGTTGNGDSIGTVARSDAALDCAVAVLNGGRRFSTTIMDFPGGIKGVTDPAIGMRVAKSGRTTGTTRGMVEGVSADEFTVVPVPGAWQELSMGGDSGSIWLEEASHAAVGLHYGGEVSSAPQDERAWAKRIARVANRLNIAPRRKGTLDDGSRHGPAVASLGGVLLLGWVGGDSALSFSRSSDGLAFGTKATLPDFTPAALSLTVFRNRFVVAWIGLGNRQLNVMQSPDGAAWSGKVTLPDQSDSAPALAVHNSFLYLAWRGVDDRLTVMRSADGSAWSNRRILAETSRSGPALVSFRGRLRLGWRAAGSNALNLISSSNGSSFSGKRTLADTTTARPFLHAHARRLHLAWQGVGNRSLNVLASSNGTSFGGKITLRETCIDGPGLGSLGDDLVWAWCNEDPGNRINTLLYDLMS